VREDYNNCHCETTVKCDLCAESFCTSIATRLSVTARVHRTLPQAVCTSGPSSAGPAHEGAGGRAFAAVRRAASRMAARRLPSNRTSSSASGPDCAAAHDHQHHSRAPHRHSENDGATALQVRRARGASCSHDNHLCICVRGWRPID
jgi:hypothetical protein